MNLRYVDDMHSPRRPGSAIGIRHINLQSYWTRLSSRITRKQNNSSYIADRLDQVSRNHSLSLVINVDKTKMMASDGISCHITYS